MSSQAFYDFSREALAELLAVKYQEKSFRAQQLFEWIYRHRVTDFDQMTNISSDFRQELKETFRFDEAETKERHLSNDGTIKFLFKVPSGVEVESVLIKQDNRKTLCISSQYGCGMGCKFCSTGTMGFLGNLTTADILAQVNAVLSDCIERDDSFQNIVFMGMGEPLHNFKAVVPALQILTDTAGLNFAPRRITVSTVGLVPAIKKFSAVDIGVNLAVSLNATDNQVRSKIMPINDRFPLEVLLQTLRDYSDEHASKRKKITIEYVMLKGVNDRDEDLRRLPKLLKNIKCKVNLIPYNENADLGFSTPSNNHVYRWFNHLKNHFDTTIRWSKGQDIKAACGQLISTKKKATKDQITKINSKAKQA